MKFDSKFNVSNFVLFSKASASDWNRKIKHEYNKTIKRKIIRNLQHKILTKLNCKLYQECYNKENILQTIKKIEIK